MADEDLAVIEDWLRRPHVARWWTPDTTAEAEVAKYRRRISQACRSATVMLTVLADSCLIGWCQWYRWADYPSEAVAMDARDGEVGIDYAIGDPASTARGVGTQLIALLVTEVLRRHPDAGFLVGPDAANVASRRVLEKNGFELVAVRSVVTEPTDAPIAIYRLPSRAPMARPVGLHQVGVGGAGVGAAVRGGPGQGAGAGLGDVPAGSLLGSVVPSAERG